MTDLASLYSKMNRQKWKTLDAIFDYMWDYEFIPIELIAKRSGINPEKVEAILKAMSDERLVVNKQLSYFGSAFTFTGLSLYSLWRLVKRGHVSMLGKLMGEGKESVVYNCYSEKYGEAVIKFHRVGYPSFKKVREKRDYGTLHFTVLTVRSARNEFRALQKVYGFVSVPQPYAWEGNAVMMELIEARELFKVRLTNPQDVLEIIIDEIRRMYSRGVIHGDLSQYNIIVSKEGIWLIDFPQCILLNEEEEKKSEAEKLLRRDVENVISYFRRAYGIEKDINTVMEYIKK